jgi:predicted DCC family thiol-disulfide oxidoreductase YuxK
MTSPDQSELSGRHTALLYDDDCGFCRRSVQWLRDHNALGPTRTVAWQSLDPHRLPVARERLEREIILVRGDDIRGGGATALALAVTCGTLPWKLTGRALRLPVIRTLAAYAYRKVAANRHRMPGSTAACEIPVRATASPKPRA